MKKKPCHVRSVSDTDGHDPQFMEIYLPAGRHAVCDLSTLKPGSGSLVEVDQRRHIKDILCGLETTAGDGYAHQPAPEK